MYPKNQGWNRFWHATIFSLKGLLYCFRNEAAMKEYTFIFLLSVPAAYYLGDNPVERILLIGSGALVIIIEQLNSAIEATLDRIST